MKTAALVGCCALLLGAAPARAQQTPPIEPDPRAEEFNERGKSLFSDHGDYEGAAEMFRKAIEVTPDARYYYNLCASLERLERWREALDACDAVFRHGPRGELAQKTGIKAAGIREKWREQRERERAANGAQQPPAEEEATGNGQPATGNRQPATAETAIVGDVERPGYVWGLGADIGLVVNGSVGGREYARSGFQLRLNGQAMLWERARLGLEVFLHFETYGERRDVLNLPRALSIFDLGAAVYWHKHITRSLHFTPLGGLSLAALSVDDRGDAFTYGTLGLRLEAALEWRFPGGRHVLRVVPLALGVYAGTKAQLGGDRVPSSIYGLDRGGTTWSFTVGYTYRFEKAPFPVWNLE